MNLSICGRHLDVTPAIREYVMNKLARVLRHFDHVIDTQVMLSVEPCGTRPKSPCVCAARISIAKPSTRTSMQPSRSTGRQNEPSGHQAQRQGSEPLRRVRKATNSLRWPRSNRSPRLANARSVSLPYRDPDHRIRYRDRCPRKYSAGHRQANPHLSLNWPSSCRVACMRPPSHNCPVRTMLAQSRRAGRQRFLHCDI